MSGSRSDKRLVRDGVVPHAYCMPRQQICDDQLYCHFVTFNCFKRRRLLDDDRAKRILLGILNSQLAMQNASCVGFVIMPDHVHAIVWFPEPTQLSYFLKQWKQRSSVKLKEFIKKHLPKYANRIDLTETILAKKVLCVSYSFSNQT